MTRLLPRILYSILAFSAALANAQPQFPAIPAAPSLGTETKPILMTTFVADVTPPIGSPLCNGNVKPAERIVNRLTARGIVLIGRDKPIVLCAFDWVGIGNAGHDVYRSRLARAVGTDPEMVTIHTLHQHDAPACDFSTEDLLKQHGLSGYMFDPVFARDAIDSVCDAAKKSMERLVVVTHVGVGTGIVKKVASNRRILGDNGKVKIVRFSSSRNPAAIAAPEGVVDPKVQLIAFWNGAKPIAALTHYATHPQSYYGKGAVNHDFPGMARAAREKALPGVRHIHFTGGGGNIGAGKYNNGSPEVRPILAQRLEAGMKAAWDSQKKTAVSSLHLDWSFEPVSLPVRNTIVEATELKKLANTKLLPRDRCFSARAIAFKRRVDAGKKININCLTIANARVLYMPGELFVEYQLAAQKMRPDLFVATAAYGQYSPGYIGTKIAYTQGGYETGKVSRVGPNVEDVLMGAMQKLLTAEANQANH
ncbi:MAG: hypothetical protein ACKVJX_22670 [Verrucomicrobiia bacterium]